MRIIPGMRIIQGAILVALVAITGLLYSIRTQMTPPPPRRPPRRSRRANRASAAGAGHRGVGRGPARRGAAICDRGCKTGRNTSGRTHAASTGPALAGTGAATGRDCCAARAISGAGTGARSGLQASGRPRSPAGPTAGDACCDGAGGDRRNGSPGGWSQLEAQSPRGYLPGHTGGAAGS